MRFHLTAAFYVIFLSFFYGLSAERWAVVILLISAVLAAELVNTSIEALCDLESEGYSPLVKIAKDVAAGAVLALSVGAFVTALIFYTDFGKWRDVAVFFLGNPWLLILLLISVIISVAFTALGPRGLRGFLRKRK